MNFFTTLFILALVAVTNAHLFIFSPAPITGTAPKEPLDKSGSNFPCHGASLPTTGGESMPAGSSQLLSWDLGSGENTAVHGGGSCQISITYETDPAKQKDPASWKVIYSIEDGCPSNTAGNLDSMPSWTGPQGTYTGALSCDDPKANGVDCVNHFNFTMPKGVQSGHAILAWTWFNTVGNREIYMNCVNADITGGDGSEMDGFPSMFVANLASVDTCATVENTVLQFPFPGKYVTTKTAASATKTYPIALPACTDNGAPAKAAAGSASGSGSSPSPPPISTSAAAVVTGSSVPSTSQAASAGVFKTQQASSFLTVVMPASSASSPVSSSPVHASAPVRVTPIASASAAPVSGSSSCASPAQPCTGVFMCFSATQFGLCNHGCALPQAVAAGTQCLNGAIVKK